MIQYSPDSIHIFYVFKGAVFQIVVLNNHALAFTIKPQVAVRIRSGTLTPKWPHRATVPQLDHLKLDRTYLTRALCKGGFLTKPAHIYGVRFPV